MAVKVIDLKCSGCGNALAATDTECAYCGNPVIVSSFNAIKDASLPAISKLAKNLERELARDPEEQGQEKRFTIGCCYLRLKLYDKAIAEFEAAIENNFDNPEPAFYAAVALLRGKKAFVTPLPLIKKALEYIGAAIMIEERGIFFMYSAYIKYDFYARKSLRISPSYIDDMSRAREANVPPADVQTLFSLLGVEPPSQISELL